MLDFGEISKYILGDLYSDVKLRLFGNNKERRIARQTIINKAVDYAQAKTSLSKRRATELVAAAIDVLRNFYKSKVSKELLFVTGQICDTVIEQEQKLEQCVCEVGKNVEEVKQSVKEASLLSINKDMQL